MGNNKKKGQKANVFKVAGAKSLKKSKAKAVNLGLKNIKQKVVDLDSQFLNAKKNPTPTKNTKAKLTPLEKKTDNKIKQKVVDLDSQFLNAKKNPTPTKNTKAKLTPLEKKTDNKVTKEEIVNTAGKIDKMDI